MILNIPVAIIEVKKKKVFKKPHNKISSTNPNIILIDSEHKIPKRYLHFLKYTKTMISDTQLIVNSTSQVRLFLVQLLCRWRLLSWVGQSYLTEFFWL